MITFVIASGGFDPLHTGHLDYLRHASQYGDYLIVGVNSDAWLARKKGRAFMPVDERRRIVASLEWVNEARAFDQDTDADGSCIAFIQQLMAEHPTARFVFANGGDRTDTNIPEMSIESDRLTFAFGVGGTNKANSSRWILDEWKSPKHPRPWGYWRVLDDKGTVKTKELVIEPGQSLSDQKHQLRSEHWYVLCGSVDIETEWLGNKQTVSLNAHQTYVIEQDVWHKASNNSNTACHILEVQYGEQCIEEDIQRR